jgi:hypothetical protein
MIREGYIERSIRKLRQVFAAMMGKMDKEESPELLDGRLDDLYREHLGIGRQILAALDEASQLRLLRERPYIAAELLRGERDLLIEAGRTAEAADAQARLSQVESKAQA